MHVQSCFANLNLLLFDVLVTFAVVVSKLAKTFRRKTCQTCSGMVKGWDILFNH